MGKHRATQTCIGCDNTFPLEVFRYPTSRNFSRRCPDCRHGMKRKCRRCGDTKPTTCFPVNLSGKRGFICENCYMTNPKHFSYLIRQIMGMLDAAGIGGIDLTIEQRVAMAIERMQTAEHMNRVSVKVAVELMRDRYEPGFRRNAQRIKIEEKGKS